MSSLNPFTENILRVVVAQIFKTCGWNTMSSGCLNVLTDVLHRHIKELCDMLRDLSDTVGVAEPSISEVILLFRKLGINFENLGEYIDIADTPVIEPAIPKYPIPKPPSLNLLNPDSKEMVTRPVHIHEHLPPMYPELEDASEAETVNSVPGTSSGPSSSRRGTVNDVEDHVAQLNKENMMQMKVDRPMRQLTCVTMTSSGFLSSSCEGKLAESRLPLQYVERKESPEVPREPKIKSKHTRRPSASYSTADEDEKKMKKEHKKMKKDKKHKNKDKEEKKKEKLLKKEEKKLKKEKKRLEGQPETLVPRLKLTLGMPFPQLSPSSMQRNIVIKPVIDYSGGNVTQYEQNERFSSKREHDPSPERNAKRHKQNSKTHDDPLATTSGMVETFALPQVIPKANPLLFDATKPKRGPGRPRKNKNQQRPQNKRTVAFYYDSTGNQIWICPSCGAQDDGSPTVGCDGCDAWFHWVCVGMTAAPESKKWFCPLCLG